MPLDPAQWIGEWSTTSSNNQPQGSDSRREGDNQIRDAKKVIKDSFPNILGAATPTHTQFNTLSDISTSQTVETRLSTLEDESARFVGGTCIIFFQSTLPVGYTEKGENDCLMRVTTVASGEGGGNILGAHNPVVDDKVTPHQHTFTSDSAGNHVHDLSQHTGNVGSATALDQNIFDTGRQDIAASGYVKVAGAHVHTGTVDTNTGGSSAWWEPKYINVIMGVKD